MRAQKCVARSKDVAATTLEDLQMPLSELTWRALVPGAKRISVLVRPWKPPWPLSLGVSPHSLLTCTRVCHQVGRPGSRMFLALSGDGTMVTHTGRVYESPLELYLDTRAFGTRRMQLFGNEAALSVWYVEVRSVAPPAEVSRPPHACFQVPPASRRSGGRSVTGIARESCGVATRQSK